MYYSETKQCTPYAAACKKGHLDVVRYLTEERRCDPLCKGTNDDNALILAAAGGSVNILKYFVEEKGYDEEVHKMTFVAIETQNLDAVRYLSSIGASGASKFY